MKNEELLKTLIDVHFRIDSVKEGNTLNIKVEKFENKDKENFENWLKEVDDDVFLEMVDRLPEGFNNIYQSDNYKDIINIATKEVKNILNERINKYKMILGE